jgi:hypothetical protein
MTTSDTKSAIGEHQRAARAKHNQSAATFRTHGHSPKAHDIEAFALSNLHGDPMIQLAASSVRSASNRVVQRCVAIAGTLVNFRR